MLTIRPSLLFAVLLAVIASTPASAQFRKPEDQIRYRQGAMNLMGNHMGRIGAQLKSEKPDAKAIAASAGLIAILAPLPFEAFGKDTMSPNSRAKPDIWSDAQKFDAARQKMLAAVERLDAAAKAGEPGAVKSSFGAVADACKACHDAFWKE